MTKINPLVLLALATMTGAASAQSNSNCFTAGMPPRDIISACDQVIANDTGHAQAHIARGLAWYELRDYDRAISDFSRAIGIDPKYVRAFYYRGLAFEKKGKLQDALADYRYFAQVDPSYPDAQRALKRVTAGPTNVAGKPVATAAGLENISMEKSGGVYVIPVRFNDIITLPAIVDSGASDVSIPADIVSTLIRTKTITDEDFLGEQIYVLADGSKVPSHRFRIRSLKVGNKTVENVVGSIASVNATILLGQSFLSKFKSWSVDNEQHTLILR
ncbi:retroviral-like aspartic protease family protein [Bradyrhizobium sp. 18BD]